jgi:hypothetical protein
MGQVFAFLVGLSTAVPCIAVINSKGGDGPLFGAPFPGSAVMSVEPTFGCGERYAFSTAVDLSAVANFYLGEGRDPILL